MKRFLLVLNPFHPRDDQNGLLVLRLIPYMNVKSHIVSTNANNLYFNLPYDKSRKDVPKEIANIPITFTKHFKILDKITSSILKHFISIDKLNFLVLSTTLYLTSLLKVKKDDIVLSTNQIYFTSYAASRLSKKHTKALFLLDPSLSMINKDETAENESDRIKKMLKNYDVIFTTRFIQEAMEKRGYSSFVKKIVPISFPMIMGFNHKSMRKDDGKILLLYTGCLYLDSPIRCPKYFLEIISHLDSRFKVMFIGLDAPQLLETFPIKTDAEIVLLPQMNREKLYQYVADADVLINIGNGVPVHLPSKTLEYINTGKPIVNFYKFNTCPTLYYTNNYPLCLNLNEQNKDMDTVVPSFIEFCLQNKGKSLSQAWIAENYSESTPKVIAETVKTTLKQIVDDKKSKKKSC